MLNKGNYKALKTNLTYDGRIILITKYGLFVELPFKTKGLIHFSKTGLTKSEWEKQENYAMGQELKVKILQMDRLDTDKPRVNLTLAKANDE